MRKRFHFAKAQCIDPANTLGLPDTGRRFRGASRLGDVLFDPNIIVHEGVVLGVYMTMDRARFFDQMKVIMIERYGPPMKTTNEAVTTSAGARLSSERLEWTGGRVRAELIERSGQIDRSRAVFTDLTVAAQRDRAVKGAAKEAAGKL
jgi:hypothetical protein